MTVQLASCHIAQYYRCDADPVGDQRTAIIDASGKVSYLSRIDSEARWLETADPETGNTEVLGAEADPASLSGLIADGHDDYDFTTEDSTGSVIHHRGFDRLTGRDAEIDGVRLQVTEFEITGTLPDGSFVYSRKGQQYLSAEHGRFYGGIEEVRDWSGAQGRSNDSPVRFDFPEDAGFASMLPMFGCDLNIAAY